MPQVFPHSKLFPGLELPNAKNFEVNRLKSYHNWKSNVLVHEYPSTLSLAKGGFCYSGEADVVECAFCGLQCCGKVALTVHQQLSPECQIFTNQVPVNLRCGPNIKLCNNTSQGRADLSALFAKYVTASAVSVSGVRETGAVCQRNPEDKDVNPPPVIPGVNLRLNGVERGRARARQPTPNLPRAADGSAFYTATAQMRSDSQVRTPDMVFRDHLVFTCLEPVAEDSCRSRTRKYSGVHASNQEDFQPQFYAEDQRRLTFNRFPEDNRNALAQSSLTRKLYQNGFFFTGQQDIVICYCCGISLYKFLSGDDPKFSHAIWSPSCRHLHSVVSSAFIDARLRAGEVEFS